MRPRAQTPDVEPLPNLLRHSTLLVPRFGWAGSWPAFTAKTGIPFMASPDAGAAGWCSQVAIRARAMNLAAPRDVPATTATSPGRPIRGRASVGVIPAIFGPLVNIAVHVMKTK